MLSKRTLNKDLPVAHFFSLNSPIGKVCILRTWYGMYGLVGRRHVYQIDTYNLSKVWVVCVYHQYLVKYGSYDGRLTKYL